MPETQGIRKYQRTQIKTVRCPQGSTSPLPPCFTSRSACANRHTAFEKYLSLSLSPLPPAHPLTCLGRDVQVAWECRGGHARGHARRGHASRSISSIGQFPQRPNGGPGKRVCRRVRCLQSKKDRPPSARSSKSRRFPNCQKVSDSALSGQRRGAPSRRTLYRAPRRRIQYRCMYSIPVHGTGSMQISSSGTGWLRSSREIIDAAVAPTLRARACADRIVMRTLS